MVFHTLLPYPVLVWVSIFPLCSSMFLWSGTLFVLSFWSLFLLQFVWLTLFLDLLLLPNVCCWNKQNFYSTYQYDLFLKVSVWFLLQVLDSSIFPASGDLLGVTDLAALPALLSTGQASSRQMAGTTFCRSGSQIFW